MKHETHLDHSGCLQLGQLGRAQPRATAAESRPSVVVDTSGSMQGKRIDQARQDILDIARQLPPSAVNPLIIVPYNDKAGPARVFTTCPLRKRS